MCPGGLQSTEAETCSGSQCLHLCTAMTTSGVLGCPSSLNPSTSSGPSARASASPSPRRERCPTVFFSSGQGSMHMPKIPVARKATRDGRGQGKRGRMEPAPQDPTPPTGRGSGEWEQILDDLATGRIYSRLSLDHRQEMALINWNSQGSAPGDEALTRVFRAARARIRRTASPSWRLLPLEDHGTDTNDMTGTDGSTIREQALAALHRIATWPAGTRRFFLAVALDDVSPVHASRTHLAKTWTARQARHPWESLRVRLSRRLQCPLQLLPGARPRHEAMRRGRPAYLANQSLRGHTSPLSEHIRIKSSEIFGLPAHLGMVPSWKG